MFHSGLNGGKQLILQASSDAEHRGVYPEE